ncbi:MAG: hypothetical protein ACFFDH_12325 [Promethearchaeota archaeon]
MTKKYSRKKLRKISHLQTVKNAPVAVLFFLIIIFQFLWFISLSEISITYDFSNYTEKNVSEKSFDGFMEDIFTYINENQINFTMVSNEVLQNDSLISEINYSLNYTITTVEQIFEAVNNKSLDDYYLNQYIRQLWFTSIKSFIPEGYFQSAFINITNEGWATIQNVDVYLDLFFRNKTYRLLKPLDGIKSLSSKHQLILNLSIAELLSNLILLSFDQLVNTTFRILLDIGHITDNILIYFYELFNESLFLVKIHFSGNFGFIPLSFDMNLDIKIILQNIMGGI